MARHFNITGELTQELLAAGSNTSVSSISLCNVHATLSCRVSVYIEKANSGKYYLLKSVALPVGATLVHENIVFDNSSGEFGLFIKLTKSASEIPTVDIILM